MDFSTFDLDPRLKAGISAAGYTVPTPIQVAAIPAVLAGSDVMGMAQTGTGKTAAFVLPILHRLLPGPRGHVRALIIAPTRELAEQIRGECERLAARSRLRCVAVYGGVPKDAQTRALRRGAEIVVACPGRLLDLDGDGYVDLSHVETLVLDEADRLCDMGFLPDVRRILARVPAERQTLFFSATMPVDIRSLAAQILRDPVTVQVDAAAPATTVSHAIYPTTDHLRTDLLLAMVEMLPPGRVLIFTRTKFRARTLARALERHGHSVSELQGNMTQNRRQAAMDGFRSGRYEILVATDIAARGIDVADIRHVINFDMPDCVDAYTHRIGRTGRALQTGAAFSLAAGEDAGVIRQIEQVLGERIERRRLDEFDYGVFNPDRALRPGGFSPINGFGGGRRRAPARRGRLVGARR
ncbi:MAG: DEAD/DEAH box helicase [Candidatus Krumholzibacteriia bacterium]